MAILLPQKYVITISFEQDFIHLALFCRKKTEVCYLEHHCFHKKDDVKRLYTVLETLSSQNPFIALLLHPNEVLFRTITQPKASLKELTSSLPFQLEPHLPLSLEEVLIISYPIEDTLHNSIIAGIVARRESICNVLKTGQDVGLSIDSISFPAHALASLLPKEAPSSILIYLSNHSSFSCFIKAGILWRVQPLLQTESVHDLSKEVEYLLNLPPFTPEQVVLTGPLSIHFNQESISSLPCLHLKAPKELQIPSDLFPELSVATGFALSLFSHHQTQPECDFLQEEFAHKAPLKKMARSIVTTLSLSIAFLLLCFFFSHQIEQHAEQHALENIEELYLEFNNSLQQNAPLHKPPSNPFIALDKLQRALKKTPKPLALTPPLPSVSVVLSKIQSFPQFSSETPLKIESVRYKMLRYPNIEHPFTPYEASVSIEFTSSSSKEASSFHAALLNTPSLVDTSKEVTWHSSDKHYHCSFHLSSLDSRSLFYPNNH